VVVVIAAIPIVLLSSPVAFPTAPHASPVILAASELVFPSYCLPSTAATASERQLLDPSQSVKGLVEDSSLVVDG
jgi:hypothetical protein